MLLVPGVGRLPCLITLGGRGLKGRAPGLTPALCALATGSAASWARAFSLSLPLRLSNLVLSASVLEHMDNVEPTVGDCPHMWVRRSRQAEQEQLSCILGDKAI